MPQERVGTICDSMQLHPSQQAAICHGAGPAFVLAGPGSGKTMVLTNRIVYLIRELSVPPERILVMTFTKAAALEMEARFLRICPERGGVAFGTFHSVFFRILKESGRSRGWKILSGGQQAAVLTEILKARKWTQYLERDFLRELVREISRLKAGEGPMDFSGSAVMPPEQFEVLYRRYEAYRQDGNWLDFDDILLQCRRVLSEQPKILEYWRGRFDFFLVDEFQDASALQYELVRLLAAPKNHLFVVGDDDQAIYGFRGAAPDLMLRAYKELPDCRLIRLEVNYRSTGQILKGAAHLIGHNKKRFAKHIVGNKAMGEEICFREYETQREQAEGAAEYVTALQRSVPAGAESIAILFRKNRLMKPFAKAFLRKGIPFSMKEPWTVWEEHWAVADVFSYVRLAAGCGSREDQLRILNKPFRGLSREVLRNGAVLSAEEKEEWALFQKQLALLASLPPFGQLQFIRKGIGYEAYCQAECERKGEDPWEVLEQLEELQKRSVPYRRAAEWLKAMETEQEQMKQQAEHPRPGSVRFLTIHGAKGLEFDTVILPDWNDGVLPHKSGALGNMQKDALEEERRLAYVAVTRAKSRLFISWVRKRYGKEQKPSPFVEEMQGK